MSEEKTKTEQLRERIMLSENKGVKALAAEEIARADEFCEGYKSFLNASPVEREAVAEALAQAKAKGFAEYDPEAEYKAGDKVYLVNRGKAIALAVIDKNGDTVPFLSIIDDETSDSPFGCAMHIYTNLSPYDTEGRFQQQSDIRHELLENGEQQKKR